MDEPRFNKLIRNVVLVMLCCQNASHALMIRYSQGILKESYSNTEVVFVGEVIKLVVSGYLSINDRDETDAVGSGFAKLFWLAWNCKKILLLVFLYSIANMLAYQALSRVDASVYTVLLQLKVLTTATFSIFILNRSVSSLKWRALLLLVLGCILVASPSFNRPCELLAADQMLLQQQQQQATAAAATVVAAEGEIEIEMHGEPLAASSVPFISESAIGVLLILVMVVINEYSAIYFEQMLKRPGDKLTVWERNFQLALYSSLLLTGFMFGWEKNDGTFEKFTLFDNWTPCAVLISLIQAMGGLLVAASLKYADAVMKTLATSGSIVLSAVLGYMLLGGTLDVFVAIGCCSTILAITDYANDPTPVNTLPPIRSFSAVNLAGVLSSKLSSNSSDAEDQNDPKSGDFFSDSDDNEKGTKR